MYAHPNETIRQAAADLRRDLTATLAALDRQVDPDALVQARHLPYLDLAARRAKRAARNYREATELLPEALRRGGR